MSTIKILHVIARMNVGGTARYVGYLIENISGSGLATGYVQGAEIEDPVIKVLPTVRIQHLGRRISLWNDFRSWMELRKIVKEIQPLIIHTHTFKAGLIGRLIWGNHKLVHTYHGHLFDDRSFNSLEKRLITFAERLLAFKTDQLISVGDRVGIDLRAKGIGLKKTWISIPPGVKPLTRIDKNTARAELNLNPDVVLIGWMARLTSVKNPFLLLEVARLLPEVEFAMAGGGDLYEEVKAAAPDNVSVIGWSDASLFWSAVDCAISTSDNEGIPIALIEAMGTGLPIVATNVGSVADLITDGINGFLAKNEANEIARILNSLLSDNNLMQLMATSASQTALKNFSPDKMLTTHQNLYSRLLE